MTRDEAQPRHTTHLRGLVPSSALPVVAQPPTGTLDTSLPWVIESARVGTAYHDSGQAERLDAAGA